MKIELDVCEITVFRTHGPDRIIVRIDAPTTFPSMEYEPTLVVETQQGYGKEWCVKAWNIVPKVIDTRTPVATRE